jgi:hypothetical protein
MTDVHPSGRPAPGVVFLARYDGGMNTDPIETYRGVCIYHDKAGKTRAARSIQFRCFVNGKLIQAETVAVIRNGIDRQHGMSW